MLAGPLRSCVSVPAVVQQVVSVYDLGVNPLGFRATVALLPYCSDPPGRSRASSSTPWRRSAAATTSTRMHTEQRRRGAAHGGSMTAAAAGSS